MIGRVVVGLAMVCVLVAACESVGVGVGVGFPIGSRGAGGISVGGTVPLPAKPPAAPASAASTPQ